ncbi:MAG: DNA polymerase III subunit delta [Clostridia bacterium]|nr:DNA polymerase III subunit delta [Clostridia bacterium]
MPIVDEKSILSDIKTGVLAPIYFIFGNDSFLKQAYSKKIVNAVVSEDDLFNYQKFTNPSDLQEVYDAVMQLPMMQDKKCVVLNDYDFLKADKTDFSKLVTLCEDVSDDTVLVMWFDWVEIDTKSDRVKKLIKAIEKNSGRVVKLDHPTNADLIKTLINGAKKRGCHIEPRVAQYLIENCSNDVNILQNELEKLCAYVKDGAITEETIDLICVKSVEASVYDIAKNIITGRVSVALKILDDLLYMRTDPIVILSIISSAYIDLCRASAARVAGVSPATAASDFSYGNRDFLMTKAFASVRNFDSKKIMLSLNELVGADKNVKSLGSADRTVLEQVLVRLAYIAVKGESID